MFIDCILTFLVLFYYSKPNQCKMNTFTYKSTDKQTDALVNKLYGLSEDKIRFRG